MDEHISLYGALRNAYDVAREIAEQIERDYLQGLHDTQKMEILSGCYSVVDFFANLPAVLGKDKAAAIEKADPNTTLKNW